jgi:hypothetical protein
MVQYHCVLATSVSTALRHSLLYHRTSYLYVHIFVFVCVHIFLYYVVFFFFFCNLPDNRKAALCIVKMTNESDRQNGGFTFVFTLSMATLLCRNHVTTGASNDSCGAQDCSKINTLC